MDMNTVTTLLEILPMCAGMRHVLISTVIFVVIYIFGTIFTRKVSNKTTKMALKTTESADITTIAQMKDVTQELLKTIDKTIDVIEKNVEIQDAPEKVAEEILDIEQPPVPVKAIAQVNDVTQELFKTIDVIEIDVETKDASEKVPEKILEIAQPPIPVVKKERLPATNNSEDFKQSAPMQDPVKDINILLMGETGVGKSTFINAFANYITYTTLQEASEDSLRCLIPTKFTVTDQNYQTRVIEFEQSENEVREVGASATQNAKSYTFWVENNVRVRLIDTPGIGDTRGADQDIVNFDKILSYLGEFEYVHAICVLLKPNNARITVMFEYCIKQLLSHLEKSASRNLMFVFTNSRSTFYLPGDTFPALRKILEGTQSKPPYVEIPLTKQNIFCVDNEAFRFLVASVEGIQFGQRESEDFSSSWKISAEECMRILTYVASLAPHQVQNTISINEARRLIVQLSQPLADIANLIQINIEQLQRHQQQISLLGDDMKNLKKNLYIPVTNLRVAELAEPSTVCTAIKCCAVYQVNQNTLYHYKQRCHSSCSLKKTPKEIVGSPELIKCRAMGGRHVCRICGCSYLTHMHVYYQSTPYEDNIVDENITKEINTKEKAKKKAEEWIEEMETRRQENQNKQDIIIKTCAKFAHFLQNNALTTYNDAYKRYLEYLIDRENSLGESANKDVIDRYQNMVQQYVEEKKVLDDALNLSKQENEIVTSFVSAKDIIEAVQQLYGLPHCGAKIKELCDKQNRAKRHECVTDQEVAVLSRPKKRAAVNLGKTEKPIENKGMTYAKSVYNYGRGIYNRLARKSNRVNQLN